MAMPWWFIFFNANEEASHESQWTQSNQTLSDSFLVAHALCGTLKAWGTHAMITDN